MREAPAQIPPDGLFAKIRWFWADLRYAWETRNYWKDKA